ncbi:hypothetical protein JOC86_002186 [Bacillus pakistanensis]|uniref:Uncharacterized protein n=1 Tax=Rossellomorea pakistanensis TaxID=992288 RepID=A0ABS2NCR0_9BACI|nr:hypothetical protein [Bacillus pakistanensis]
MEEIIHLLKPLKGQKIENLNNEKISITIKIFNVFNI